MKNTMQYAGVINSEETMAGSLPDGRRIYVEMLSVYLDAVIQNLDKYGQAIFDVWFLLH